MKRTTKYVAAILLSLAFQSSYAQREMYITTGGEMLFQTSEVTSGGTDLQTNMRWTIFLHLGSYAHIDFTNNIGMFSGLALRNVGFITNEGTEKKIRRTYNLGIPLALKVGLFDKKMYVFGGAEYEWLFHYKEKYWPNSNGGRDGDKIKSTKWFSSRVNSLIPSVFFGIALPGGFNVKYKIYLENYMNQSYADANGDLIYQDLDVNVNYISISWNMRNSGFTKTSD